MAGTADILGHESVVARLTEALRRDALHHALLFEGPAGVGKATVARWLAMAANCTAEARPCGACAMCKTIQAGSHPDVVTLSPDPDRATPIISVDQVREVVRVAGYHRYGARRRFILIDPADALRDEAANALLKTLEEPPEGTGFVLIATHARALLPTIVSRCQRVRFSTIREEQLVPWLTARGVAEPARAARASLGCPGVALRLAQGELSERAALRDRLVGAVGGGLQEVFDLSEALTKGARAAWRPQVEALIEVIEDLLRDVTVRAARGRAPLLDDDAVVADWQRALWPGGVARCARAIVDAREDLEVNVSGRLVVDALVTRVRAEVRR